MKKQNKKLRSLYLFLSVLAVAFLAFYSFNFDRINNYFSYLFLPSSSANSSENLSWKVYQNKLIGFEIKFPADWQISEESFAPQANKVTDQSNLIDIFPGNMEKDFLHKITIEAFVDGLIPNTNEIWETYVSNYKSWNLENKQINNEFEINGTKFIFIEGVSTEAGIANSFSSKVYLTKINQGKGMLAIIIRDKNNPQSDTFNQIVKTFKFN